MPDLCDCCSTRVVRWSRGPDSVTLALETLCLKDNAVRVDESTIADAAGMTDEQVLEQAYLAIKPTLEEWADSRCAPEPVPVLGRRVEF